MRYINGTYDILYIQRPGYEDYTPIGCLESNDWTESTESIGTTTRANMGWTSSRAVMQSFGFGCNGLVTSNQQDGSIITYSELVDYKREKTNLNFKILDNYGNGTTGVARITEITKGMPTNGFVSFSCSFEGQGAPEGITPNTETSFDYTLNQIF